VSFGLILAGVLVAMFVIAYLTKRRFGVLGLALAAGAVISTIWTDMASGWLGSHDLNLDLGFQSGLAAAGLTLAPAMLLLFSGPTYSGQLKRIVGAGLFALLAAAFMVQPIGSALVLTDEARQTYELIESNRDLIIGIGLIVAIFDVFMTKTPKPPKSKH